MLNPFFKEMEQKLKEEQKRLREELQSFAKKSNRRQDDYDTRFPDYGTKEDENAAEVSTFQDELSLEKDLERELQEVDAALERINQGDYRQCEKCHRAIDERRLRAFPAARTCVECKG